MDNCPGCGQNHAAFSKPMPDHYVPIIDEYTKEGLALVERILADNRLGVVAEGDNPESPNNVRMSVANTVAATYIARMGLKMLERVEETVPQIQSREQLALAFAAEFADVEMRTGSIASFIAQHGVLPNIVEEQAKRNKDSATVH